MEKKFISRKSFVNSLSDSKIDSVVKVRGTNLDHSIKIPEEMKPVLREAWASGKYKTKTDLAKAFGYKLSAVIRALDPKYHQSENIRKRQWSKDHPDYSKEYRSRPEVKESYKEATKKRVALKREYASGPVDGGK